MAEEEYKRSKLKLPEVSSLRTQRAASMIRHLKWSMTSSKDQCALNCRLLLTKSRSIKREHSFISTARILFLQEVIPLITSNHLKTAVCVPEMWRRVPTRTNLIGRADSEIVASVGQLLVKSVSECTPFLNILTDCVLRFVYTVLRNS